ncbi:MAG: glycosyl transferase, partial [Clostridia bacterium]
YLTRKLVPPKILPRFDFAKTIDKKYSSYVVIPTIIASTKKIDELVDKLEVTYLANRTDNMYYMLIGDCVSSQKKHIDLDDEINNYAKIKFDELNDKYPNEHKLFNFIYRKRVFNNSENSYMGWERKRGAICEFNKLILNRLKNIDDTMYLLYDDIVKTKYAITIDEDTDLSLNTAKDLVAIMAHPLNAPKLSKNKKYVVAGHGLIQPGIGLDIEAANKSIFSKIFGGFGGLDIYTNAVSNTYQDLFNEAIFCGKGIYDIQLSDDLIKLPENLVLSHDLLEGSYLRAGLASDIQIQEQFPINYIRIYEKKS